MHLKAGSNQQRQAASRLIISHLVSTRRCDNNIAGKIHSNEEYRDQRCAPYIFVERAADVWPEYKP